MEEKEKEANFTVSEAKMASIKVIIILWTQCHMCRVLIEGGCLRSELYQDLNYNLIRILRAFHFSADPVPDLDPALHQSNENLQRVVYKPSRATF